MLEYSQESMLEYSQESMRECSQDTMDMLSDEILHEYDCENSLEERLQDSQQQHIPLAAGWLVLLLFV